MATKRYEHQKCYIYDMPKHIYKPDEVKEGVKKVSHLKCQSYFCYCCCHENIFYGNFVK